MLLFMVHVTFHAIVMFFFIKSSYNVQVRDVVSSLVA